MKSFDNIAAVAVCLHMAIPQLFKAGFEFCHIHFHLPTDVNTPQEGKIVIRLARHGEIIAYKPLAMKAFGQSVSTTYRVRDTFAVGTGLALSVFTPHALC